MNFTGKICKFMNKAWLHFFKKILKLLTRFLLKGTTQNKIDKEFTDATSYT